MVEVVVEFHAEDVELQVRLDDFRALGNNESRESMRQKKKQKLRNLRTVHNRQTPTHQVAEPATPCIACLLRVRNYC